MSYHWESATLEGVDIEWTSCTGGEIVSIPGLYGSGPDRCCARTDFVYDEGTGVIGDQYGHDFLIEPGPTFHGFGVDGPSLRFEFVDGGHVHVQERLWMALVAEIRVMVPYPAPRVDPLPLSRQLRIGGLPVDHSTAE